MQFRLRDLVTQTLVIRLRLTAPRSIRESRAGLRNARGAFGQCSAVMIRHPQLADTRSDVGGGGRLLLPRAGSSQCKICLYQLCGFNRPAGNQCYAAANTTPQCYVAANTTPQCFFRDLPLCGRIQSGLDYSRHGVQFAFSRLSHSRFRPVRRTDPPDTSDSVFGNDARSAVEGYTCKCGLDYA